MQSGSISTILLPECMSANYKYCHVFIDVHRFESNSRISKSSNHFQIVRLCAERNCFLHFCTFFQVLWRSPCTFTASAFHHALGLHRHIGRHRMCTPEADQLELGGTLEVSTLLVQESPDSVRCARDIFGLGWNIAKSSGNKLPSKLDIFWSAPLIPWHDMSTKAVVPNPLWIAKKNRIAKPPWRIGSPSSEVKWHHLQPRL